MTWKRTEKHPEYANHCQRLCARYGVRYEDFDVIRDAIEENIEDDPIEGSVPVAESIPEVRRFVYEPLPHYWGLPPLVVVYETNEETREFTLLEIWSEEELEEQA